ncbi:hypothetical protein AAFF_G00352360 [Aldrovandia affinis]|uniref:Uncharacterized protein n=1 Tax=Aldrovandia affinis TaxID=143900 RepID=A0AAD7SJ25_9TELE|nr:hypothetical protein AAFF_G00352360 [Aldrovandia affinis]
MALRAGTLFFRTLVGGARLQSRGQRCQPLIPEDQTGAGAGSPVRWRLGERLTGSLFDPPLLRVGVGGSEGRRDLREAEI